MRNETRSATRPSNSSRGTRRPRRKTRKPRRLRKELSAGGVIYRVKDGATEFFFIKDPYGKWTFPKGHQELGETLAETAIREIREETGLTGLRYVSPLGRTDFRFRRGKTLIEKSVYLFLFEAAPDAKEELPGTEGIMTAEWIPAGKAVTASGYRNLDKLLAKALRLTSPQPAPHARRPGLV